MRRFTWVFAWVNRGWTTILAAASIVTAAHAQTLAADEIGTPYPTDNAVIIRRGPYAAMPAPPVVGRYYYGGYDEALPPFEVVRIMQSTGFEPLGRPIRRRWIYTVAAINPDGEEGRVTMDARTGRIMRFVPAVATSDDIGPVGPPSAQKANARTSLRPPMPVPHVATRTPPTAAGKSEPRTVGAVAPQSQSAPSTPAQTKSAENKPPVAAKPEPPAVQLQPTQPMPPVQDLE